MRIEALFVEQFGLGNTSVMRILDNKPYVILVRMIVIQYKLFVLILG